ncbi:MAG TPA: hypothetical protein PLP17_17305, partial [Oligoflexia bacterium]|nr:hypothetical protein [Oligoflexia bacterium]
TFFGQLNWVKLFNIGGTATSVVIEAFDLDGVSLGSVNVALDAIKGKDVELRALGFNPRTNGYGFFTVSPADANVVVADVLRVNNSADEISVDEGNILPIR